jgi:hypothetical protein
VIYNGKKVKTALYLAVFVTRDREGYDAFLARFLKILEILEKTPQKRLPPKTAPPKACVSHHDHSEVHGHGRFHGLSQNTFGARPPGYMA